MAPKIPRWKLDTGQNRNCLTNCTAGSQEERSLRVEWLTRKGHVSKKPEVVRGRCTCSPSRRPFPPAVPSNKVLSQRNHVCEYVSRYLFLLLPPQNRRAAFSRVCKGSNATGIPFQKWAKYLSLYFFWPERKNEILLEARLLCHCRGGSDLSLSIQCHRIIRKEQEKEEMIIEIKFKTVNEKQSKRWIKVDKYMYQYVESIS